MGIGLPLAGCSLNPQPFPPADLASDAGATGATDGAVQNPDAGSSDATKGADADATSDAPIDSGLDSGEAGDAETEGG